MVDIQLALSLGLPVKLSAEQAACLCQRLLDYQNHITELQQERDKAHAALDLLQMQVSITLSEAIDMGDCYEISGNSFNDLDDISKSEIVQSSLVNKLRNQAKGESK